MGGDEGGEEGGGVAREDEAGPPGHEHGVQGGDAPNVAQRGGVEEHLSGRKIGV